MKNQIISLSSAVVAAVSLFLCITACELDSLPERDHLIISPLSIPPASEREVITEADIFGDYDGQVEIFMNGTVLGTPKEKITFKKLSDNKTVVLKTREKTVYPTPHNDFGYVFDKVQLSADKDGKLFSFSAHAGILQFYEKQGSGISTAIEATAKPVSLKDGYIYKKEGKIHIGYTVEVNMDALRNTIPLLPKDHKSLVSIMKDGKKQ